MTADGQSLSILNSLSSVFTKYLDATFTGRFFQPFEKPQNGQRIFLDGLARLGKVFPADPAPAQITWRIHPLDAILGVQT
jgi:hypothetical protein